MSEFAAKMLNKFEFDHQNPLAELQLSQAVFPAVIAVQAARMEDKIKEDAFKYSHAVEDTRTQSAPKQERAQSSVSTQRLDRQEIENKESETNNYTIVYFNPETKKAEVVEGSVSLNYGDRTEKAVEESVGQRSFYSMYSFVSTPLIREQVDEQKLKEIMDKIKIETPDPFGGGAAVQVSQVDSKTIEKHGDEIVALEVAEARKAGVEERLNAQIQVVDEVLKNYDLPSGDERTLSRLPALSRQRMLVSLRKKKLSKKDVKELLLKDLAFLKTARDKMGSLGVKDMLKVVLKIKE